MRIRDEQMEQIRAALLKAGTELIEAHGLEATTIESITARAGVAKGTFYNYFKTKHDLIYAAVHEDTKDWARELECIMRDHPSTFERVYEVFRRIIEWVGDHPELNWIWFMERLQRTRDSGSKNDQGHFQQIMERLFAAGQAAGEVRTDRPPSEIALDLGGIFLVHVARAYHLEKPEILSETMPGALASYFHGVATTAVRSTGGDHTR